MGGDALSVHEFVGELEKPLLEQPYFPQIHFQPSPNSAADDATLGDEPFAKVEDDNVKEEDGMVFESYDDDLVQNIYPKTLSFDYETRQRNQVYRKLLDNYEEKKYQIEHFEGAKANIMSYRPGLWIEHFNGMKLSDYDVPNTTTLLLVGPKRSGKSSLVNRISRVLDDDKFACDRAQVSCNNYAGDGTYFLMEYMVPRGASSFCLYDTRSLSEDSSENMDMLKRFMTRGVRHGDLVVRDSDSSNLKNEMKCKARHSGHRYGETRTVNFVIFVVNGLSILRSMEGDTKAKLDMEMVARTFNYSFLSFRDDKPLIVMTHGDLLSLSDRVRVRLHLGELFGVPPMTQIFDIPENHNRTTELEVVGMLRYCLEHADRNLQGKLVISRKVLKKSVSTSLVVLFALLFIIITIAACFSSRRTRHSPENRLPTSTTPLDWRKDWRRHLWLGEEYD